MTFFQQDETYMGVGSGEQGGAVPPLDFQT